MAPACSVTLHVSSTVCWSEDAGFGAVRAGTGVQGTRMANKRVNQTPELQNAHNCGVVKYGAGLVCYVSSDDLEGPRATIADHLHSFLSPCVGQCWVVAAL